MGSLPEADRDALLALGHAREFSQRDALVRAGEAADSAIVLVSGLVKIHRSAADGDEVVFGIAGAGDLFGEMSVIRDTVRSATATALTSVAAITVGIPELRSFFSAHAAATSALLELTLGRLYVADMQRLEFATADSLGRVTSRLVELAERFGETRGEGVIEVPLPLNQEELASWSAASRESTARALRTLRELDLIETDRLHVTVLDLERLRNHAARI